MEIGKIPLWLSEVDFYQFLSVVIVDPLLFTLFALMPLTESAARVQPHTAAAFQLTESGRLWDRGLSCGIRPPGTSGGCDSWGPCMKSLMVLPPGVT